MRKLLVFLFILWFLTISATASAQDTAEIDKTISQLQEKIAELKRQENTLSKQITLLDSQVRLTTLKIAATRAAIEKLSQEIKELIEEIDRLEVLLTRRSELVLRRIPETYKRSVTPRFGILLFSQNFFDFITRAKYLSRVQAEDAQLLFQLKATQSNYSERKTLREKKRQEQEELQRELERQTQELARQKREKQVLLEETKNSEVVYQQLLAQALAEKQALERAIVEAVKVGPVKRGDPIGLVGNTGYPACSTGPHLHFEVRKGGSWVDPGGYLSSKTVKDEQNGGTTTLGSGSWDWPLADTIRITQRYGQTPYSWRYTYSGGIHTGYDMVSTSSEVIKAAADGTLYSSSQVCGGGSIIKIKYIDHGDNTLSFYLHVQ